MRSRFSSYHLEFTEDVLQLRLKSNRNQRGIVEDNKNTPKRAQNSLRGFV
jgi:hypothetical protein